MEKEKFGIDIDEVLLDTISSFLNSYNSMNKTNFKRDDFYTYQDWGRILRVSNDYIIDEFYEFMLSERGLNIPKIPGSYEALDILKENFSLVCITYRSNILKKVTYESLEKNFPNMINSVYFADYSPKKNFVTKARTAEKLGLKYLVEDQLHIALECSKNNMNVYLFDSPWNCNEYIPNESTLNRVHSWQDILNDLTD